MKDQGGADEQSLYTRITPLNPSRVVAVNFLLLFFVIKLRIIVSKNMLTSFTVLGN